MNFNFNLFIFVLLLLVLLNNITASTTTKKKNIVDFDDADIERLYEEWEENDEEKLPDDELPPHKRPSPKMDLNLENLQNSLKDKSNIEGLKANMKKGQTLMIFVRVNGNPTKSESEEITALWQTSLFNANYEIKRYMVDDDRAIFMVKDGSRAWEVKDYLINQERCLEVTIDNEKYMGLHNNSKETDEMSKNDL